MPQKTQNYKLEYFKQGSSYSASSDYKRFVTLDYNLSSYIGVVGVGIIQGWTIDIVNGLTVQILPGTGVINGFFSESPYVVKQRSDMVAGDREIEVLNENNIPEQSLTPSQRAQYVSVIQLYDPLFNPVGDIENAYVKVVVPTQLTLSNNSDNYIYVKRPIGATPYPLLLDYPPPAGNPPNRANFSSYDDYRVALDIYNAKLDAIHNYEWYSDPSNHFTAVEFSVLNSLVQSATYVLLGRVVARNNSISKIDVSGVDSLSNFQSQIKRVATEYLVEHQHGGNKFFDPPKVRLETDIRDTSLWSYNSSSGVVIYSVLERESTGITLGHKHTYMIDASGNGQTIEQIGSTNSHFHKITSFSIGTPESTIEEVTSHIHSLSTTSEIDTWDASNKFVIYVNGSVFGDETTPYIHADSSAKTITFDKGINISNSKYSTDFSVVLINPYNGQSITTNYSYTARDASIYHFMLKMINDYNTTFASYYNITTFETLTANQVTSDVAAASGGDLSVTNIGYIQQNIANNPFIFYTNSGGIAGLQDLESQSSAAQSLLIKEGDQFTFTPNAANNISVSLLEVGHIDEVKIEILGNTEVTGVLKAENILYLNANKILTGEFIPQVIPFISHVGRIKEQCFPLQYNMISNDGIRYGVVPTITDPALDHYHKLQVDNKTTGVTTELIVGNDVVYYQNDKNNNTYFIYHSHGVDSGIVSVSGSNGLLEWQNNVGSTTLTTSDHTHNIIYPVIGNEKTIYSIKEDVNGNIYVGTSDGFIIIPQDPAYQFVINGLELYFYGSDLWDLLGKAKSQYEAETGSPIVITEAIYGSQLESASLVSDGDSVLLVGTAYPNRKTDNIMIKRISSFSLPNFKYIKEKNEAEVLPTETIIESLSDSVIVERNFNDVPIWSIELDTVISTSQNYISSSVSTNIVVTGSNLVAKNVGINKTTYQPWTSIDLPFVINVVRKTIKDPSGNYWICTNNGVLVSRYYSTAGIFEFTSLPGGNPDVQDIENGERDVIYCASTYGIFKTIDSGKSWNNILNVIGGFKQITRDKSLDKSTVINGHYHNFDVDNTGSGFLGESIGSGIKHVHTVSDWNVAETMGHTHTMIVTLYVVDNSKIIWKSIDNGANWIKYASLPDGECGSIFAAFGCLFVSQSDGLYKNSNGTSWNKVMSNKAYSYEWSYDMSELLIGSNNILYGTFDGVTFTSVFSFSGNPSTILIHNGSQQYFDYAYSNISQSFHFKNLRLSTDTLAALVDFERWYAQYGGWTNTSPYDVYINNKRVLSTKYNEDKREVFDYNFNVIPSLGELDFSATTQLSKEILIYDSSIDVASSNGFSVNDSIVIMSNENSIYSTISSINGNVFTLDSPSSKNMPMPSSIKKIPSLNGQSSVIVNVYDSILSNIGTLTHDQVEDGLSNYSDGRPYKFNDTYLSNLLQLTQAVRYAYPDINSEFINDMFYDFRYSLNPLDPYYINNYIDILTSETYNQKIYDSNFVGKWAKSINKILVGFGPFSGKIMVATDIGMFISEITPSFEANWFYVNDLPYSVYDLMIFKDNILYAATSNGTYYTGDLKTWVIESSPAISYPSYSLGLRWLEDDSIIVPSHSATFTPNTVTNIGTIIATSGTPYSVLSVNREIKITGADDKDGSYIINAIKDSGNGFGSEILVTPSFSGIVEIKNNVVIDMGNWWKQWDGDVNTSNPNITNTLLVGGEDHISYNDGSSWIESSFNNVSSFISRKFLSLTNGRALVSATGTNISNHKNYLLKSDDIGKTWDIFRSFEEVRGTITSIGITDFNNSVLTVSYTQPQNYVYVNGILDQQNISVFSSNSTLALFSGKVVWNEKANGNDTIVVFGNNLSSIANYNNLTFVVYPSKVNTMIESSQDTLFFGTDKGMYYDVNTVITNAYPEGTVTNAGINGIVEKIDISGYIVSLNVNPVTNNTVLSVVTDTAIRKGDIDGKFMYITDTNPVEKYIIASNSSLAPGNELSIEITVEQELSSAYIGKRFRILGEHSRVYINFDLPVLDNQFNSGTVYISSDEYGNLGTSYGIFSNSSSYIDLQVALIPATTLAGTSTTTTTTSSGASSTQLQVGQSVRLIDSSNHLTLWVTLNKDVKENSLTGLSFVLDSSSVASAIIVSNLKNSITINTNGFLNYSKGDSFVIQGAQFEQVGGFSHLLTSIDSDHYHNVETVNAMVSGDIQSFSNNDSSYVDIIVTNTKNFNTPLVQYSGDLFNGAQIVFTTPETVNLRYISEVISYTSTTIRVRLKSSSYWDFVSANPLKISAGWTWEIDGTDYGYTSGIIYDDFVVLVSGITATVNRGVNQLKLQTTAGINIGDKIQIQDSTLSYEINTVGSIINATTIQLSTILGRTFFLKNNPQVKVLRNSFANTHIHQIRNNEVQPLIILDYLANGYPSEHSHRVLPLVSDISTLLNQNNSITVFGSSSIIYKSNDNGSTWETVVDLNGFLEGSDEVNGVSSAILKDDKFIVGATNGNLFVQTDISGVIINLNNPI